MHHGRIRKKRAEARPEKRRKDRTDVRTEDAPVAVHV